MKYFPIYTVLKATVVNTLFHKYIWWSISKKTTKLNNLQNQKKKITMKSVPVKPSPLQIITVGKI
jgi:hypothetical protein